MTILQLFKSYPIHLRHTVDACKFYNYYSMSDASFEALSYPQKSDSLLP